MSGPASQQAQPSIPEQQVESAAAPATVLAAYYSDRKLMWRNVLWITFGHFGMALSMTIVEPLMSLRLKAIGVSESGIGLLTSMNLWAVSFLVMYFSWKSDHCRSRLGRRTPFVLLSLPFLALALILFPLTNYKWFLVALMLTYFFFNDMKASTYPLLSIDCVSKEVLARVSGLVAITISLAGFLSTRLGAKMADVNQTRVFFLAAAAMTLAPLLALWRIKEPPIYHPTTEKFNLLAPIKVAMRDKRTLVLMVAIALLNAFPMTFKTWVWFYSRSKLNLVDCRYRSSDVLGTLAAVRCFLSRRLVDRPLRKLCGFVYRVDPDARSCGVCNAGNQRKRLGSADDVVLPFYAAAGGGRYAAVEDDG